MTPLGTPKFITLHWTAGTYDQTFPEYHWCVKGDGTAVQTLSMQEKGAHCWGRNTGNIGVSMCAMAPHHPVTPVQVEHTAKLVAELCHLYGIDPRATVQLAAKKVQGDALVDAPGNVTAPTIADHAFFARKDGYYPERWDIGEFHIPIQHKAQWYFDALAKGTAKPEFATHVK